MTEDKKKDRPYLTNSTADIWTDCQMKYKYRIEDGLRVEVAAPALSFGDLWHRFQENYWKGLANGATAEEVLVGLDIAIDEWERERKQSFIGYAERVNDHRRAMGAIYSIAKLKELSLLDVLEYLNQTPKENIPDMIAKCRGMADRYVKKYHGHDADRWEVLDVEKQFVFPLMTLSGHRSLWDYKGKFDAAVKDKSTGLIYVIEHKTMADSINPEAYKRELPLKPQPKGYLWAIRQLYGSGHGVIYNVARKKLPCEPMVLQKAQEGRNLSVAKGLDTTPEIWLAAIRTHNPEMVIESSAGVIIKDEKYRTIYESLRAKGDTFMFRHEMSIPDSDIREWEIDRWRVARSIGLAKSSKASGYTRNYNACFNIGRSCEFRDICLDRETGHLCMSRFIKEETHGAPELDHDAEEQSSSLDDIPFGN